jgi:hypothetical protein
MMHNISFPSDGFYLAMQPIVKRTFLVFFVLLCWQELAAQTGTWKKLAVPKPIDSKYAFIDFADSINGWLLSADRRYTMTSDGGKSWSAVAQVPDSSRIVNMKLYDDHVGILVAVVSEELPMLLKIVRTTDHGVTWSKSVLPDSTSFSTVMSLVNRVVIGFISDRNVLYTSSDLGVTWDTVSLPMSFSRFDNVFGVLENGRIVVGGGSGGLVNDGFLSMTTDAGITWEPFGNQSYLASVEAHFLNSELCYFWMDYDENEVIMYTDTRLYNAKTNATSGYSQSMAIGALYDDGTTFAFGAESVMSKASTDTTDSTYEIRGFVGTGPWISQLATVAQKYAWILDDSGNVFQRIDLLTSVGERKTIPVGDYLSQNYPNPFNPETTIDFRLSAESSVILKVYDLLGREVATLVNGKRSLGHYSVNWDATTFPSGVYFCRLSVNHLPGGGGPSLVQTRRMLIIK